MTRNPDRPKAAPMGKAASALILLLPAMGLCTVFIFIPALLAKKSRELAPDEAGFKAPGGQPMVVAVIVFGVLTAIFHLMAMAGLLPVYTG